MKLKIATPEEGLQQCARVKTSFAAIASLCLLSEDFLCAKRLYLD